MIKTTSLTMVERILKGETFYERPAEKVSASLRFLPGEGFEVRWPNCWSSQYYGGTCYCDSHPPFEEEVLTFQQGLALLRAWGYQVAPSSEEVLTFQQGLALLRAWGYQVAPSSPDDERVKKLRRQVEDRLRKGTALEVVATAAFLGLSPRL